MARKPDTPCSSCGRMLWSGSTSLPPERRVCRPCRTKARAVSPPRKKKARQRPARQCEVCSAGYRPTYAAQRTCGRACGEKLRREITGTLPPAARVRAVPRPRQLTCVVCSAEFETIKPRHLICGAQECRREYARQYMKANYDRYRDSLLASAHRRHTRLKEQFVEDVSLDVLYRRDRGRCGVCRRKVPPPPCKRGPLMPSIDHIVPISEGGEHSYANTRLAHYRCNLSRGNGGGGEQLMLIG